MQVPTSASFQARPSVKDIKIHTYGTAELCLGIRYYMLWRFIVADVTRPIIGADLLGGLEEQAAQREKDELHISWT